MTLWFATETWPFGAALALMVALFILEGLSLIFSASLSGWLDGMLPDLPDDAGGALGWLHLGKVPFLILLGLFLAGFAIAGYVVQMTAHGLTGNMLPALLVAIPAALAGVAAVSSLGRLIARYMPLDETVAVSEDSLIGRSAVITQGVARRDHAAQAKVRDEHGRTHYILIEPDLDDDVFEEGSAILLVRKQGARFRGIRNPRPDLI